MALKLRKPQVSPLRLLRGGLAGQGEKGRGTRKEEASSQVRWADAVESARKEWLACRAYFNCVTDPELVDHAIFAAQAAERKYMYLLRRARLAGAALDRPVAPDGLPEDGPISERGGGVDELGGIDEYGWTGDQGVTGEMRRGT